jgi:hypothetical protein
MQATAGYRLVLPPGWIQVPVRDAKPGTVHEVVSSAFRNRPEGIPRDSFSSARIELERRLDSVIRKAKTNGGLELFLACGNAYNDLVPASFLIAEGSLGASSGDDSLAVVTALAESAARQDAHVPAPGRRREPGPGRARRPVLRIAAQPRLQPLPRVEQAHPVRGKELRPLPDRPRVRLPCPRRMRPSRGQLPQPLVNRHHRPGRTRPVLEQQVVIDQHRHPLRDQRPVPDVPGLPAQRREENQDHEPQP